MLKNFWYAVEFAHEVTRAPRRVTCLGQDFVLYRKRDGAVVCLSDLCVHRGAALSNGKLVGDEIACPYHGWQYEPGGACTRIPANPEGRGIPKKARVDSYPIREEYGLIWAFLGDLPEDERPPIPHFPEHDDPSFATVYVEMVIEANYERTFENVVDASHTPFVPGTRFGNPDKPEIPDYESVQDDWSAIADISLSPPPARGVWKRLYKEKPEEVLTTNGWYLPNIVKLHVRLPFGDMVLYDHNIPSTRTAPSSRSSGTGTSSRANGQTATLASGSAASCCRTSRWWRASAPSCCPTTCPTSCTCAATRSRSPTGGAAAADGGRLVGRRRRSAAGQQRARQRHRHPSPARRENPELARAWQHRACGDAPVPVPKTTPEGVSE